MTSGSGDMPTLPSNRTLAVLLTGAVLVANGLVMSVWVFVLSVVALVTFSPLVVSHGFQMAWIGAFSGGITFLVAAAWSWRRDSAAFAAWQKLDATGDCDCACERGEPCRGCH